MFHCKPIMIELGSGRITVDIDESLTSLNSQLSKWTNKLKIYALIWHFKNPWFADSIQDRLWFPAPRGPNSPLPLDLDILPRLWGAPWFPTLLFTCLATLVIFLTSLGYQLLPLTTSPFAVRSVYPKFRVVAWKMRPKCFHVQHESFWNTLWHRYPFHVPLELWASIFMHIDEYLSW